MPMPTNLAARLRFMIFQGDLCFLPSCSRHRQRGCCSTQTASGFFYQLGLPGKHPYTVFLEESDYRNVSFAQRSLQILHVWLLPYFCRTKFQFFTVARHDNLCDGFSHLFVCCGSEHDVGHVTQFRFTLCKSGAPPAFSSVSSSSGSAIAFWRQI